MPCLIVDARPSANTGTKAEGLAMGPPRNCLNIKRWARSDRIRGLVNSHQLKLKIWIAGPIDFQPQAARETPPRIVSAPKDRIDARSADKGAEVTSDKVVFGRSLQGIAFLQTQYATKPGTGGAFTHGASDDRTFTTERPPPQAPRRQIADGLGALFDLSEDRRWQLSATPNDRATRSGLARKRSRSMDRGSEKNENRIL